MPRPRFGLALITALLFCCAAPLVHSQVINPGSIHIKVVLPSGGPLTSAAAIRLETFRGVRQEAYTDNQGQYNFHSVAPGSYQVVVEADRTVYELVSINVEVYPRTPSQLTIVLKEKKAKDQLKKQLGIVTAVELDAQIPGTAKAEFERASALSKEGKSDEAIAHLRRAIEIHPGYLMAHNNLGVQLLGQGKLDEAEQALRKAIALDPKAFNPGLNLGIVLVHQQRFSEAAETLRRALALDPNSAAGKLYLGRALSGMDEFDAAEVEFKAAHTLGGVNFASALYYLGHIYLNKGQRQNALETFKLYLSEAPKSHHAAEVTKLVEMLR